MKATLFLITSLFAAAVAAQPAPEPTPKDKEPQAPPAAASDAPAAPGAEPAAPGTQAAPPAGEAQATPEPPAEEAPPKKDRGVFLAGAKVGLVLPFDGLGVMAGGVIEVGYILPVLKRNIALSIDVGYTQPAKDGSMTDPRVTGEMGTYSWHITQQELTVSVAAYYRLTFLGRLVPYIGIGPRVYLHKSTVQGSVGSTPIQPTTEQLTKVGFMIPVGASFHLGPGELFAEFLFEYGRIDDVATGWASTAGGNVQLGYRFTLGI